MKNRIFSIVVTLVLAVSMILGVAIVANAEDDSASFKGGSLNLAENITIYMYVAKADVDALTNPTVTVTLPDGSTDTTQTVANALIGVDNNETVCYVFTAECTVKDYDKPATISIVGTGAGEEITGSDSVLAYCNRYTEGVYFELVSALKDYGKAAKDYFITEGDQPIVTTDYDFNAIADAVISGALPEGIIHRSATLLLESKMTIRHYFELVGGAAIDSYKFYADDKELIPNEKDGRYYVDIEGITPHDINNTYTLAVEAGDVRYTCSYGALTYVKSIYNKVDTTNDAKNLVSAIAEYNQVASKLKGTVTFSDGSSMEYKYGITTPITKVPVVAAGEAFVGWMDENGHLVSEISASQTGDITLTAKCGAVRFQQVPGELDSKSKTAGTITSTLADNGFDLLDVNVPATNSGVALDIKNLSLSNEAVVSMTISKVDQQPFLGFQIRLRNSTNTGSFLFVGSDGTVEVGSGETVVGQITEQPATITLVLSAHPTNLTGATVLIDGYINGKLVADDIEYSPKNMQLSDLNRLYMLFNFSNTEDLSGSMYIKDFTVLSIAN